MAEEGGVERSVDYFRDSAALIKDYGDKAIQCCISAWNELCPQHQLNNITEVMHGKRGIFHSHDVAILEEAGGYGQISKITFEVNGHLTAKYLRKYKDSPRIVVDCCTWWDCGDCKQTHGWSDHIVVDAMENCVTEFPEITPASPHFFCCPLP